MLEQELNITSILNLIKFNKKFILTFILVSNLCAGIYLLIAPQTFTSSIKLMPPKEVNSGGGLSSFLQSMAGNALSLGGAGKTTQSAIFAEILKSRLIMDSIDSKLNLVNNNVLGTKGKTNYYNKLSNIVEVSMDKSGFITYTVNFTTSYFANSRNEIEAAEFSQKIASNAIISLDEILRNKNISSAKKSKEYIEIELKRYYSKLDTISKNLEYFQEKNKVLALEDQTQAIVTQAITLGTDLNKYQTELNLALIQYDRKTPYVQTLQKQVDFIKSQLNKVQSGSFFESNDFAFPLKKVPQLAREYTNLFRDKKIIEQVIMYLETQRHQEAIQEEKDLPIVEILEDAIVPEFRTLPNKSITLTLSFIMSIILCFSYLIVNSLLKGNLYLKKVEIENKTIIN